MSPYKFDRTYEKWKKYVARANIYIVLMSFAAELISYVMLKASNNLPDDIGYYKFRYLYSPTVFHLAVIVFGRILMQTQHFTKRHGDYIPLIQLMILCTSNAMTHHIFPVITGSLCFPIFVSTVYDNPKLTRNIWLSSYVGILIVFAERKYVEIHRGILAPNLSVDTAVAASLTFAAYITCGILARFQAEKSHAIEEMHQYELQLREELNRESKTGLYNYSAFLNKLYRETEKSRFTQWPLMLLIIDIDDFKRINDTYGHARGDRVLKRAAEILKKYFKDEEFPARYGGEEFTAIVRENSLIDLKARVEHMRQEFAAQSYDFMNEAVTLSVGIAQWQPGMNDEQLFDHADRALYRAKEMGKDRIVVWSGAYEKI